MSGNLKLSLRIVAKNSGDPVCFKQDGQRFGRSETVKFNANTEYLLNFTFRPSNDLEKLNIDGESYNLETVKDMDNDEKSVYSTAYSTSRLDATKGGTRKEISFLLELENRVHMKFSLQCKIYKAGETSHANWGQKLSSIDMDCKLEAGHNYISIDKDRYL